MFRIADIHPIPVRPGASRWGGVSRQESGMSILEVLVCLTIISLMSLSVAYFAHFKKETAANQSVDAFNCQIHVNSILSAMRAEGQTAEVRRWYPHQNTNNYQYTTRDVWGTTQPDFLDTNFTSSIPANRYTGLVVRSGENYPRLNLAPLQVSSVNLIEKLYNEKRDYLCGSRDFRSNPNDPQLARLNQLAERYDGMLRRYAGYSQDASVNASLVATQNVVTQFRVVPYNILTGNELGCTADLNSIPLGQRVNNSALSNDLSSPNDPTARPMNEAQDATPYIGYKVEVFTTVTDIKTSKVVTSCNASQLFEHQRDYRQPTPPTVVAIVQNNTLPNFDAADRSTSNRRIGGNSQNNEIQIAFKVTGTGPGTNSLKQGTVLLCQDRSLRPETPAWSGGQNYGACMGAVPGSTGLGPGPQRGYASVAPEPIQTVGGNSPPYNLVRVVSNSHWLPCDQVTLCGRAPAESHVTDDSKGLTGIEADRKLSSEAVEFINIYRDVRSECVANIAVRSVDESGNILEMTETQVNQAPNKPIAKAQLVSNQYSPTTAGPELNANTVFANNSPFNMSEIARNTCGVWRDASDAPFYFGSSYGSGGYWQTGAQCVSEPAPASLVIYMGVSTGAGGTPSLTPRAENFIALWNKVHQCRPGWSRADAGDVHRDARGPAYGNLVSRTHSQDRNADASVTPRPYVDAVDQFRILPVNDNHLINPAMPPSVGARDGAGTPCGILVYTEAELRAMFGGSCRVEVTYGGSDGGSYFRPCTPAELEAKLEAYRSRLSTYAQTRPACNIPNSLVNSLPADLQDIIGNSINKDNDRGALLLN